MNDRTITRAARHGVQTVPVESGKPKQKQYEPKLRPDEITLALEIARQKRVKEDIAANAHRRSIWQPSRGVKQ
ncbi:hypothetical protein [Arthrobacter sp. B2a2-09]|uniref:hypothetical protein n=1 Tax=Arthrobacter sp. B2a2-09 TaxID=2952822 RepID=UPI0022CD581A|nr:hypothetical protein [Arthrobacter sp. B2a2-09]MCZ9884109.1 hypothetical protein [Arthrobacter sp. B2a2-09]